jgi:hypothetical protein
VSFRDNANKLLLQHMLTAKARGMDYAPDTSYEQLRANKLGKHTLVIGRMLHSQAQAWAADRQEAFDDGVPVNGRAQWDEAMRLADERVVAYLEANGFRPKAAA